MTALLPDRQALAPSSIRPICRELAPVLREQIDWDGPGSSSTWNGDGKNGKALEVLAICWIVHTARNLGLEVTAPPALADRPGLFYLRNELPRSNTARAGHSDAHQQERIEDSFLAALTPKLTLRHGARVWSLFREGLPVQTILDYMKEVNPWQERPDLLIVEGEFRAHLDGQLAVSNWQQGSRGWLVTVRTIDSPYPQVVDCEVPLPADIPACAVVEVSNNKVTGLADTQLGTYSEKYSVELTQTLFLHGGTSRSTVAGLEVPATVIIRRSESYYQLAAASREWLAKCLKLS